ncbi:MAG: flippase-like domain-containing protein [Acidobacteria bacterium]|nr:flippase-like domain-containing protein [Acidobacteriota bacterium]MCL5288099.1 flippase-like domain-containing protein [Acidobacteriota bacterium]
MTNTKPRAHPWRGFALRAGGSAIILFLLFRFLPLEQLWERMRQVSPGQWLLVLGGYLCAHMISVTKWRLMVNLAGAELNWTQAARCYFAGLFGNLFLPSLVGGDVIRAGLGLKFAQSRAGVLLGSFLDRLLDVAVMAVVAGAGMLLVPGALEERSRRIFWFVLLMLALVGAGAMAALWLLARRGVPFAVRRKLVKLRRAGRSMGKQPRYVLLAVGLGLASQMTFLTMMAVLAAACGLHLEYRVWIFAFPLAKLSALTPATLGGIGVREAALGALLKPFGVAFATAVAVGLMWETIVVAGGLLAGGISLAAGQRQNILEPQMNADKRR